MMITINNQNGRRQCRTFHETSSVIQYLHLILLYPDVEKMFTIYVALLAANITALHIL